MNKNLLIIGLIAVVNALGYGIIIPILYSYSQRFGMTDFQNGLLFAVFSIFQFISTPIIGRLSDKYGRRPLLIISLIGTALSFVMMALARNTMWLFLARALDGITAGNIPVAQAVIADTTKPAERAKGFGIIGASFGFGFIFGPAISALTVGLGIAVPFWIAAGITLVAVVLTFLLLPETNKHEHETKNEKLFDFGKLARAVIDPNIGSTLIISLVYSLAFSLFIFAYQPVSVKLLHLDAQAISINFVIFGIVGLVAQVAVIPWTVKRLGDKKTLLMALLGGVVTFMALYFSRNAVTFAVVSVFHALFNGFVMPMLASLLSKEVEPSAQGEIQGVNASYSSLGMIIGPILGGLVATVSISMPFVIGALLCGISAIVARGILKKKMVKVDL